MSTIIAGLKTALGLDETATIPDLQAAFTEKLLAEMTPEERAQMDAADAEEPPVAEPTLAPAELAELRKAFALSETATLADIAQAAKGKAPDRTMTEATLALQVKELSERLTVLEPLARKAEALEKKAADQERDYFFSEQIRNGKLLPADLGFYKSVWERDAESVKAHFKSRQAQYKLGERGSDLGLPAVDPEVVADPAQQLQALAEKKARERNVGFDVALAEVKDEHPELVEMYVRTRNRR